MKKNILMIVLLMFCEMSFSSSYGTVRRITDISLQQAVEKEKVAILYRNIKDSVAVGVTASAVIALMVAYNYLDVDRLEFVRKFKGSGLAVVDGVPASDCPSNVFVSLQKSIGDIAHLVVGMAPLIIGQAVFGQSVSYASEYFSTAIDRWRVSGFIKHETQLNKIAEVLKDLVVPFDIYSDRLSMDLNFSGQNILLQEFMADIIGAVSHDSYVQQKLFNVMRKDYFDRAASLQQLQGPALNAIAQRQQVKHGNLTTIENTEESRREQIVYFSNALIDDVERVVAFTRCKLQDVNPATRFFIESTMNSFVDSANRFALQIEEKMTLSLLDLHEESKQGQGLFDLVFDFYQHITSFDMRMRLLA